jgi:hypothetical protein
MSTAKGQPQSDIGATGDPDNGLRILARMIARIHTAGSSPANGVGKGMADVGDGQHIIPSQNCGQNTKA